MKRSIGACIAAGFLHLAKIHTTVHYLTRNKLWFYRRIHASWAAPWIRARREEIPEGRVFYINEKEDTPIVLFIHGGAYIHGFFPAHWRFIKALKKRTDAMFAVPAYQLAPRACYGEALRLVLKVYRNCLEKNRKIILMGDSAGGGLALTLAEEVKKQNLPLPDELVLISPWVDMSMENPDIKAVEKKDPWLSVKPLRPLAISWARGLDLHDPKVSPIYGEYQDMKNVTVFTGTREILYPDSMKFYEGLADKETNTLVVGENMNHVYVLFPIPEAKGAINRIAEIIIR